MKILLAVLFCVSIVDAQWQRQVITPKGDSVDTPAPHPLSYFTQYPSLRDATGDFCFMRTPEQCLILAKQQKDEKAEVRLVGKIHDLRRLLLLLRHPGPCVEVDSHPNGTR